jgi:hypothetical protein
VETALSLVDQMSRGGAPARGGVRVGVHKGPALAATVNDQLDYFGTTARDAVAILSEARNEDLLLTEAVASDPAVAALLSEQGIVTEIAATSLAGHRHLIRVPALRT